ncbi:family 1 encapsulin nanocompartment shell protein [Thiohalorhabdus methylotrophus]|uniref:Family 1 encapsulin nanocompartment shell protein n=1 Tax=Thiohalorhabdus methylotrophus TaxID=3242694 RepID=A0ABV4TR64_9GAMM
MSYLNRAQAALPQELWGQIDETARSAARDRLTGRRFLDLDGPYGLGLTSIEVGTDDYCRTPGKGEAGAVMSHAISVPMLRKTCQLSVRRIQAYMDMGQLLDLSPVEDAAEAVADREEEFIYYGQPDFHLYGLMNAPERHEGKLSDWSQSDQALNDVLAAVEKLEESGYHGPYALVAGHTYYNNLFRRYENTDMLQLQHLNNLCELGVYKAPVEGVAVVDSHVGRLVQGQDLMVGYESNDGIHYHLFVNESIVLQLQEPQAVCTMTD